MKIIGVTQLLRKKFKMIKNLPPDWQDSLGQVEEAFTMIIWGASGQGKSNFIYKLLSVLSIKYSTLYVALEESHSLTTQNLVNRHNLKPLSGKIKWANHETNLSSLIEYLLKPKSPKIIVIDSLQYFHISYIDYKHLKEQFPHKSFIFISHAKGKNPDGTTASKIRYDCGIKIRVEAYMAFVVSRYGGNKNYVIWEEGAKKHLGIKKFKKLIDK
jgi:hypothetical protein